MRACGDNVKCGDRWAIQTCIERGSARQPMKPTAVVFGPAAGVRQAGVSPFLLDQSNSTRLTFMTVMESDDINLRMLQRAAEVFGEELLANRLGVTAIVIQSWINGSSQPPEAEVMAVIGLLAQEALRDLNNTWPFNPPLNLK